MFAHIEIRLAYVRIIQKHSAHSAAQINVYLIIIILIVLIQSLFAYLCNIARSFAVSTRKYVHKIAVVIKARQSKIAKHEYKQKQSCYHYNSAYNKTLVH